MIRDDKMETSDLSVELVDSRSFSEPLEEHFHGHRLSHVPFYAAVLGIGVWSVLALLYRIAG